MPSSGVWVEIELSWGWACQWQLSCSWSILNQFLKTSNTSIEDFKNLNWRVQVLAKLSLNSISTPAQPQLNSISTQTTELGTTQLKLVFYFAQNTRIPIPIHAKSGFNDKETQSEICAKMFIKMTYQINPPANLCFFSNIFAQDGSFFNPILHWKCEIKTVILSTLYKQSKKFFENFVHTPNTKNWGKLDLVGKKSFSFVTPNRMESDEISWQACPF